MKKTINNYGRFVFVPLALSIFVLLCGSFASAKNVSDELDTLGANEELMRKIQKVKGSQRVRIVQKRAVDRTWRAELSVPFGSVAGGDPYLNSNVLGLQFDLHINPKFSVGARYYRFNNSFSGEGERLRDEANQSGRFPDVFDYAKSTTMGTLTWYPLYGKFNLFNWRVVQFDFYTLAGFGQIDLNRSGGQDLYTLGGGVGFWFTDYLSSRLEVRYQTYSDQVYHPEIEDFDNRRINQAVFSAAIGWLM